MEHQSPLITFGICEDSPALQSFIEEIKKKARREALKEMDEAHGKVNKQTLADFYPEPFEVVKKRIEKLRQEYQK
jgi:hypothetical protein